MSKVKLGDKVRDKVSGFSGIAISEHNYLNGCRRVTIQPSIDKDGKLPSVETFDDPQLEIITEEVAKVDNKNKTGGPSKYKDESRHPGE